MKKNANFLVVKNLLEELTFKRMKNNKIKGMALKREYEFHPLIDSIFALLDKVSPSLFEKKWKNLEVALSLENVNYYLKNSNDLLKDWNNDLLQIWLPCREINLYSESTKESFDKWIDINNLEIKIKNNSFINEKINNKKINEFDLLIFKDKFKFLFNIFGELQANSMTHGLGNEAINSRSANILAALIHDMNIEEKTETWTLVHIDMGMTILKNIKQNANFKIKNFSDYKILKWITEIGSSSKPDSQKVKGGGITVIKKLMFLSSKIFCISGSYTISFKFSDIIGEKDVIDRDDLIIDDVIITKVNKNKFHFPGTFWWIETNLTLKFLNNKEKNIVDKFNKENEKKLKEFIL